MSGVLCVMLAAARVVMSGALCVMLAAVRVVMSGVLCVMLAAARVWGYLCDASRCESLGLFV